MKSKREKYLLALASAFLLLGMMASQAAGVITWKVSGTVTLDGGVPPVLYVVATDPAPSHAFRGQTTTDPNTGEYTITLLLADGTPVGTKFLVFVDLVDNFVPAVDDTIQKGVTYEGADVTGVTFRLVTGVPLSGSVLVESPAGPAEGVTVFATNPDQGWKFLGQTLTGGDGSYFFYVAAGQNVEVALDLTKTEWATKVANPPFYLVDLDPDQAPPGQDRLNFLLKQGVTVTGTVREGSLTGPVVSGALVEAFYVEPGKPWIWLDADVSNNLGIYSVRVAASWGTILLRTTKSGFAEERQPVTLGGDPTTANIVLSRSVLISGQVTDASTGGTPVVGIPVSATYGSPSTTVNDTTDAAGFYALDVPVSIGSVTVHVGTVDGAGRDYFQVADQSVTVATTDIEINFSLTQVVKITGRVTESVTGNPVNDISVTALQGLTLLAQDNTDSSGNYELQVAANLGSVTIHVVTGSFYQAKPDLTVPVETADISGQNFVLDPVAPPPPSTDTVLIKKATWGGGWLTVFATSSLQDTLPRPILTASVLGCATCSWDMQFVKKRNQYELRVRVATNLKGRTLTVTSTGGGSATRIIE